MLIYTLFLSRDIAKLRLQEAKVREELEASRLRAEREMRENRLRALELKAAVARAPRSTYTVSAVAENTRHNASIGREYSQPNGGLSRSRTPSRSQQLQNGVNSGARDPQPARNPQRFIAEDVRAIFAIYLFMIPRSHIHSFFTGATTGGATSEGCKESTGAERRNGARRSGGQTEPKVAASRPQGAFIFNFLPLLQTNS